MPNNKSTHNSILTPCHHEIVKWCDIVDEDTDCGISSELTYLDKIRCKDDK